MDGKKPCGTTKVGLLDEYHLWCFLADPFSRNFVGCSVFEEHHRAGIERERECTNQREGQKYDNHMLAIWLSGAANVTRT